MPKKNTRSQFDSVGPSNREMMKSDASMIARRIVDNHPRVKAFRTATERRVMSALAKVQGERREL